MEQLNKEYQGLIKEKEVIEAKINDLNEILQQNGDVGMSESLIDKEDYPRADIDVYSVRHARHQIICLKNDYKEIMTKVESKLYEIHEYARKHNAVSKGNGEHLPEGEQILTPFLEVNQVAPGGPADQAGLKTGDTVKQFGSVTSKNFRSLQDIGLVVTHSKDKIVKLVVERDEKEYRLELSPLVWSGKGLLGCNVVELKR